MTNSSQASTTGHIHSNYMQLDIMFGIFEKLPIETIMTCKCVCKAWLRIIEDPCFIEQQRYFSVHQALRALIHSIYNIPPLSLVDCESQKARPFCIPGALDPLGETLFITSTCDGLVCIAEVNREAPVYVYNPILGQLVKLPSNGFEENILSHLVGIVYHESSRSYKVVRLYKFFLHEQEQYNFRFEMMTLGEGAWTEVSPPPLLHESYIWCPLEWRGAIHWMIKPLSNGPRCIMSFDVDSKAFQILNFIDNPSDYTVMELLILEDNLVIIQSENSCYKIWKVEGNAVGEYSIGHYSLMETYIKWYQHYPCIWIAETGRDGIYMLKSTCSSQSMPPVSNLVELSPNTGTFTKLNISGMPINFIIFSFKPTLVSPRRSPNNASEDLEPDKDFEALLISLRLRNLQV